MIDNNNIEIIVICFYKYKILIIYKIYPLLINLIKL